MTRLIKLTKIVRCYNQPWHQESRKSLPENIEQDEQGDQDDQCGQTMITKMSKVIVRCYQPWHQEIRKSLPETGDGVQSLRGHREKENDALRFPLSHDHYGHHNSPVS